MSPELNVSDLTVRFGGVRAVDGFTHTFAEGRIHGLIGPNGAGKTTLFNALTRLTDTAGGSAYYGATNLLELQTHEVVRSGISRTFQNLGLFCGMTVTENVMLGAHTFFYPRRRGGFCFRARPQEERALKARVNELVVLLDLEKYALVNVTRLPFGTQKRVELARALASGASLVLLDEPANGLAREEVDELIATITKIREQFMLTILLVEHHMRFVGQLCEEVVVMVTGKKVVAGPPAAVQCDPRVIEAYLGTP